MRFDAQATAALPNHFVFVRVCKTRQSGEWQQAAVFQLINRDREVEEIVETICVNYCHQTVGLKTAVTAILSVIAKF